MNTSNTATLNADCQAVQIPSGTPTLLPAGSRIDIVQRLGGSLTVQMLGALYRISGDEAKARGLETSDVAETEPGVSKPIDEAAVWESLRGCFDPEIPVNIVDLGLVYDLHIESLATGGSKVWVKMTLTAQGCGMGGVIAGDAQQKLLTLPGVEDAAVEIVWDPPWNPSMISPEGKRILGL